jgi:hypothetical protein
MPELFPIETRSWDASYSVAQQDAATEALETGMVLFFPHLTFGLKEHERAFLSPATVRNSKNISHDPATGKVGGTDVAGMKLEELRALLARFAAASQHLLQQIVPSYRSGMLQGRTSLRPVETAGRQTSWRKDDTRLHVDSFPSMPMGGKRILRVFSNINADGKPRVWRIGGPFHEIARKYWPTLRTPSKGGNLLRYALRITKSLRTSYDDYMLQLHDRMKEDQDYQAHGNQRECAFPAGSTWIVYTDQVPHAAMSGIHLLEQTYYVPVSSLRHERSAPLHVLEVLAGRKLA